MPRSAATVERAAVGPAEPAEPAGSAAKPRRAAALPPDERRRAIVEATLPLLLEHGTAVTTRQIAEAAGVAEGTIFRAFADKEALLAAVVEAAVDVAPLEARLAAIPPDAPVEQRLGDAVRALQDRAVRIWQVLTTVGRARPPEHRHALADVPALVALLASAAGELRGDPADNARRLRAVVIACSSPAFLGPHTLAAEEIVSLFLDGVRLRPAGAPATAPAPPAPRSPAPRSRRTPGPTAC